MTAERKNFAEVFCEDRSVPRERFADALLQLALYPHARLLLAPINFVSRRQFWRTDLEILDDIGRSEELADVSSILSRMPWYYGPRWRFRQRLRLRVSSRRVLAEARRSLAKRA